MLTSATVENFRGIERLHVEGLGRVNLIIGKNDTGKTALMEALSVVIWAEHAGRLLGGLQGKRHSDAEVENFDDFWRPLFLRLDAERGFSIDVRSDKGEETRLFMHKARTGARTTTAELRDAHRRTEAWNLEYEVTRSKRTVSFVIRGGAGGVEFPPSSASNVWWWINSGPNLTTVDIQAFSKLKQLGQDGAVGEFLRQLDDQIAGVELLAPTGQRAAVFVRSEQAGLLPLQMMGEGVQRCFEFAVVLAGTESPFLFIDEFENGLHHSVLESLWSWLANTTALKGIQVFVTTHSEECVQAACRAFGARGDDGLRVIRLDRQPNETKAVVYDRNLVEAAERMGVEIRG